MSTYIERLDALEAAVRELTEELRAMQVRPPGVFTKAEREHAEYVYNQGLALVHQLRPDLTTEDGRRMWERYFPTAHFA